MPNETVTKFLTRVEAAEYLGLKPDSLGQMAVDRRGPRYYRRGKVVRYLRADLDEWLQAGVITPGAETKNEG